MPEVLLPLVILLVIGGIIHAAHIAHRQAKARIAALAALAARLGWVFHGEARFRGLDSLYPQFGVFERGHSRHAHNRLAGRIRCLDTEAAAEGGDYHYQITFGSGKNRRTSTYRFSYLLVTLPFGRALPSVRVRPENIFDKPAAGAGGFEQIDFESAEFSRRYHVSSDNRRFTSALFDPPMLEFLLATPPPLFELGEGVLLVVSGAGAGDSRWESARFAGALDWVHAFLDRWPSHLVADLRGR